MVSKADYISVVGIVSVLPLYQLFFGQNKYIWVLIV